MYRLLSILSNINVIMSFLFFIIIIILVVIRKKLKNNSKKLSYFRIIYYIPLLITIIHFYIMNLHNANDDLFAYIGIIYISSFLIAIWQIFYNKKITYIISTVIVILVNVIGIFSVMLSTTVLSSIHNLTYLNYTDSFKETLKILKKEYVLSDHKKINYDELYNKYYPLIKKAQKNDDEQLYMKTMYEFSRNFKDGHFYFGAHCDNLNECLKKYQFVNDYNNRDYGFSSIMLDNKEIVAVFVDPNSDAYKQGLRNGMTITKKNGKDIYKELDEVITAYDTQPVKETNDLYNSMFLFANGDKEISITYINEVGDEQEIIVKDNKSYCESCDKMYEIINYSGEELFDMENFTTRMLDEDTGYLYISDEMYSKVKGAFSYLTGNNKYIEKVVDKKIQELIKMGMKDLIIDLRNNSGGYFTESAGIAGMFVKGNKLTINDRVPGQSYTDKMHFDGNGKYSNLNIKVLVNSDTVSAGDGLAYLLSKGDNIKLFGFTTTNNSFQSVGGVIYLTGGNYSIIYPNCYTLDENNNIMIDTTNEGIPTITLDEKIKITRENLMDILNTDGEYDYLLEYVKDFSI